MERKSLICATYQCPRPVAFIETRRTASMPAPGFYPVCAECAARRKDRAPAPGDTFSIREYVPGE